MKFSHSIFAAALLAGVHAQSISELVSQVPSCGVPCLALGAQAAGCGLSDYECQCGEAYSKVVAAAQPCLATKCSTDETLAVAGTTQQICAIVKGESSQEPTPTDETEESQNTVVPSVQPSLPPKPCNGNGHCPGGPGGNPGGNPGSGGDGPGAGGPPSGGDGDDGEDDGSAPPPSQTGANPPTFTGAASQFKAGAMVFGGLVAALLL